MRHYQCRYPRKGKGFTLIEMLVVLVILALTTTLLAQGLSTTWRNFEKLSSRDLTNSAGLLPALWFQDSIKGALLYHPQHVVAEGTNSVFSFVSQATPDSETNKPEKMTWQIIRGGTAWRLGFTNSGNEMVNYVQSFDSQPAFQYHIDGVWQDAFKNQPGRLPKAVRLVVDSQVWSMSTIGRSEVAEVPPELAVFGAYEF